MMSRFPVLIGSDILLLAVRDSSPIVVDQACINLSGNAVPVTIHGCSKRSFIVPGTAQKILAKRPRIRLDIACRCRFLLFGHKSHP